MSTLRKELQQIGFDLSMRSGLLERVLYPHYLSHPIGIGACPLQRSRSFFPRAFPVSHVSFERARGAQICTSRTLSIGANRAYMMPSRRSLPRARAVADTAHNRLKEGMVITIEPGARPIFRAIATPESMSHCDPNNLRRVRPF